MLSKKYAIEDIYTAYTSLQVTVTLVSEDFEKLIENFRELVGDMNFRQLPTIRTSSLGCMNSGRSNALIAKECKMVEMNEKSYSS
jgi:hypothetical protein